MRVILNGLSTLRQKSGIGHYIDSLHASLRDKVGPNDAYLFPGTAARRIAQPLCRLLLGGSRAGSPARSRFWPRRWLKGPLQLALRMAKETSHRLLGRAARRFDLYHEPNYIPVPTDVPTVATVHDLSVLLHPEWHPADRVRSFEASFLAGLRRCRHIIADSRAIRREIIEFLGVAPERVSAVPLGVRPVFQPLSREHVAAALEPLNLAPGYLLHVGTIEPRKNLLLLMKAFADLPRELRDKHPLVLIGGWGWQNEHIRDYYQSTGMRAGIRHIGYAPEQCLPALYNGARALVFPSHYEGFGFPPLEMLACGGAVLASDAAAITEVMPAGTKLLPANDLAAWREAMRWAMRDDDYLNVLKRGGPAHAAQFTWAECARQTWGVYQTALGQRLPADQPIQRRAAA